MPMGVFIPVRTIDYGACVCVYTRRGFLHCLFETKGFSYDLKWRISKRRDPRFLMSETEYLFFTPFPILTTIR